MTGCSFILAFGFTCWLLHVYRTRCRGDVGLLPCPSNSHWLWGHELEAFESACGEFYSKHIRVYGPTYRTKGALAYNDILILADPLGVAHVFRNVYNYPHSSVFRSLVERLLGRGLVWVRGELEHKRMRYLVNPAFTAKSVRSMEPAIYDAAAKLQVRLQNAVHDHGISNTANVLDFCSSATLDVIGQVGFDHDFCQGQSPEAQKILKSWKDQVSMGLEYSGFITSLLLRLFPFITSLPIGPTRAQGEIKTIIKKLGSSIVDRGPEELKGRSNLLSFLKIPFFGMLARANSEDQKPISKDELLDHICTFVMVGHETVSAAITFTLWELARNPATQACLREEVLNFPGNPSYDDFQTKLPYLDACCREGLRLHPPAAHMERVVENRDIIPLRFPVTRADGAIMTQIVVEKGQVVYVPSISVNRLSAVWGDGEVFRPERWLEPHKGLSDVKIEGWSNIFAFSDGPRSCVGYRLAVFEWKIFMLTLMRHFVFHDTGVQIISRFSSLLQPRVVGREEEGIQLPIKVTLV